MTTSPDPEHQPAATIVDLAKVTQMLDAGWIVQIQKNALGSYDARAAHPQEWRVPTANRAIQAAALPEMRELVRSLQRDGYIDTDDFTPEQALTRLAYKVHGEII